MDLAHCSEFQGRRVASTGNPFNNNRQYGLGVVPVGHLFVLFGGYSERSIGGPRGIYVFDSTRCEWSSFPVVGQHVVVGRVKMHFVVDDTLFAYVWDDTKETYTFVTLNLVAMDAWRSVGAMSLPRTGMGTSGSFVERRKEALLFGGALGRSDLFVYSLSRKSWSTPQTAGEPPPSRHNHATCSVGYKLFVVGGLGIESQGNLDLHVLNMEGARFVWSNLKEPQGYVPCSRYLFAVSCNRARLFVYGGYGGEENFDVYSIQENRWFKAVQEQSQNSSQNEVLFNTDWSQGTSEHGVVQMDEKLWIFGGFELPVRTPMVITPR